jgi:hypothetical protein
MPRHYRGIFHYCWLQNIRILFLKPKLDEGNTKELYIFKQLKNHNKSIKIYNYMHA